MTEQELNRVKTDWHRSKAENANLVEELDTKRKGLVSELQSLETRLMLKDKEIDNLRLEHSASTSGMSNKVEKLE